MITPAILFENTVALITVLFHISTLWPWAIIKRLMPRKRKDISGEIMFITGAGSGIGRGMALKFAECQATIICTDINKESCDETAAMIKEKGGKSYSFKLDVTDRNAVYKLADEIRKDIGDVTMLVNNAGIVTGRNFMDCPDELLIKTMEVNTIAHFWTLKAFLGQMMKKNHGHIITIASVAGYGGSPQLVDYCASKFGAVGAHESLALELQNSAPGVKTTSICPWFINTGMFAGATSGTPLTLPMMEPEYVVDTIVSTVLNDEGVVFIPRSLMNLIIFKNLAPRIVGAKMAEYVKLHDQMTGFKGRGTKKID